MKGSVVVKTKKRFLFLKLAILVLLYFIAILMMQHYQRETVRKGREHVYNVLQNTAKTQVEALRVALAGKHENLESLAVVFEEEKELDIPKIIKLINSVKEVSDVPYMGFADINGNSYMHDGRFSKIGDREYFKKSIKGERAIEKIQKSKHTGIPIVLISVPIRTSRGIVGILFATYTDDHFRSLLKPNIFDNEGYSYICNSDGDIIIASKGHEFLTDENKNVKDLLKNGVLDKELASEEILSNVNNSIPGVFSYTIAGQHRYTAYYPLAINDWILFSAVPASSVYEELAFISRSGQISMLIVLLSAMTLFFLVIVMDHRERRVIETEQELLRISEEEYRITAEQSEKLLFRYDVKTRTMYNHPKMTEVFGLPAVVKFGPGDKITTGVILEDSIEDHERFLEEMLSGKETGSAVLHVKKISGETAWYCGVFTMIFNDDGSPKHAIVSLEDFTEQREKELAYELWQQKLKFDRRTKNIIYYDCNLTKDVCERKEGNLGFGKIDDIGHSFSDIIEYATKNIIYEEDRENFRAFFSRERLLAQYYQGVAEDKFEGRIQPKDGPSRWIRGKVELAKDAYSTDIRALAVFKDIDERKREEIKLEAQAKSDPLTGILNRSEFIRQVEKLIQDNKEDSSIIHALIMIDVDDFKQINDIYGHDSGDKLLIEMATNLKKLMRSGDLLGRIGGDEFIICLKNIPSDEVVRKRAELICQMIYRQLTPKMEISGSLGISIYSRDGFTFKELYRKADIALYKAKEMGANRYVLYDKVMEKKEEDFLLLEEEKILKDESKINELVRRSEEILKGEETRVQADLKATDETLPYIEWDVETNTFKRSKSFSDYEMSKLKDEEFFDFFTKVPGIHPEDEDNFRIFYGKEIKSQQPLNTVTMRIIKNGKYVPALVISERSFDENGKMRHIKVSIEELRQDT